MSAFARFLLLTVFPTFVGITRGEVVSLAGATGAGGIDGGPQFAARQQTVVRGVEGHSAILECRVLNLGDKAVLWVRSQDLQILSAGGAVFTADARVSVPPRAPPAHALAIARLRPSDAGRYECQLNTEPKMSLFVNLTVLDKAEAESEPTTEPVLDWATMWDESDIHVWSLAPEVVGTVGGAVELGCAARLLQPPPVAAPPLDIRWLYDGKPLTLQGGGGGAVWRSGGAAAAESRLRLAALRPRDAGDYTCAAGRSAATVRLILQHQDGVDEIEAMQRDQSVAGSGADAARGVHTVHLALIAALLAGLAL